MKYYILLIFLPLLVSSCQNNKGKTEVVGNEKDAHGCLTSAGYRWSVVQEKCVRPWEGSIKMLITDATADYETAAYTLMDPSKQKVEVFLKEAESLILDKVAPFLYSNEEYQFIEKDNCWSLIHLGEILYEERR